MSVGGSKGYVFTLHFVRGLLCKNGSGLGDVYVNGTVSDNFTWYVDVI